MVETIVAALTGALAAGAGKVTSKAVEDAYGGLKSLILKKLAPGSEAAGAVEKLEAKPDSTGRREVLAEELEAAGAGADTELMEAAHRLQAALAALPDGSRGDVQQSATGQGIAQAAHGGRASVTVTKG